VEAHRRSFVDKNLMYLFSFDVNLEDTREELGYTVTGLRLNIFSRQQESRLYNVKGEKSFNADKMLAGTVLWGVDYARMREDDVASLNVRLQIRTDDDATIVAGYQGLFSVGPRGFRKLLSEKPKLGSEQQPFEARLFVGPRFETAAPRYKWLEKYHCLGIGRSWVIDTFVRRASYDIYAMD
jgi:Protein of unknown function (DUF3237)